MRLLATILLFSALCSAQTIYHARTDLNPINLPPKKLTWPHANSERSRPNSAHHFLKVWIPIQSLKLWILVEVNFH